MRSTDPSASFALATEFVNIPAGDQRFSVTAASASLDTAYLDRTQTLAAGPAYDVYVAGASDDLPLMVNEVDLTPVPTGLARLRIVHTALNADNVDVGVANGANLVEGLAPNSSSQYRTVDAGTIEAQIWPQGEQTPLLETSLDIQEAMVYEVVALDNANDASFQALVLTAPTMPRLGEVATPMASLETGSSTAPAIGTSVPAETPASPVVEAQIATPLGATAVAATPEDGSGIVDDVTDAVSGVATETTEQVESAVTEATDQIEGALTEMPTP